MAADEQPGRPQTKLDVELRDFKLTVNSGEVSVRHASCSVEATCDVLAEALKWSIRHKCDGTEHSPIELASTTPRLNVEPEELPFGELLQLVITLTSAAYVDGGRADQKDPIDKLAHSVIQQLTDRPGPTLLAYTVLIKHLVGELTNLTGATRERVWQDIALDLRAADYPPDYGKP